MMEKIICELTEIRTEGNNQIARSEHGTVKPFLVF